MTARDLLIDLRGKQVEREEKRGEERKTMEAPSIADGPAFEPG